MKAIKAGYITMICNFQRVSQTNWKALSRTKYDPCSNYSGRGESYVRGRSSSDTNKKAGSVSK